MSQFKTQIKIPVESIIAKLPAGSFVHPEYGFAWDREAQTLTVLWENDALKTALTIPVEFPESNLDSKQLPEGVKLAVAPTETQRVQNADIAATVAVKPKIKK